MVRYNCTPQIASNEKEFRSLIRKESFKARKNGGKLNYIAVSDGHGRIRIFSFTDSRRTR